MPPKYRAIPCPYLASGPKGRGFKSRRPDQEKALFSAENGAFSFVVLSAFHGKQLLKVTKNQVVMLNRMLNTDVEWDVKSPAGRRG